MAAIQCPAVLDFSRSLSSAGSTVELLPITSQFFRPFAPLPAAGGHVIVTCGNKEARIPAAPTDAFADVAKAASAALGVDISGAFAVCTAVGTTLTMPESLGVSLASAKILNSASRARGVSALASTMCMMMSTPDPASRPPPSHSLLQTTSLRSAWQPSCSCMSRRSRARRSH